MQEHRNVLVVAFILAGLLMGCEQPKQTEDMQQTDKGTKASMSPQDLTDRAVERRAVEAVIWGIPAVNFDRMYQAMVHDAKAGEGSNKIVYWSHFFDWKNQTLTPT